MPAGDLRLWRDGILLTRFRCRHHASDSAKTDAIAAVSIG